MKNMCMWGRSSWSGLFFTEFISFFVCHGGGEKQVSDLRSAWKPASPVSSYLVLRG
ncbi:MAG: hypothetical protein K0R47_2624 [Brevibacillus sp.]|nr:hypothetical protein [Brevibacillus sp.]